MFRFSPLDIPGPSQRADAQTKCLSGPALRKAQEYLNLRHVVTPVVNTIRVLGVDQTVADSSACERFEGSEAKKEVWKERDSHVESVSPCRSLQENPGRIQGQERRQESSQQALCDRETGECSRALSSPHELQGSGSTLHILARLQMCSYCYQAGKC